MDEDGLVEALVKDCVERLSTLLQELHRWPGSARMSETNPRPLARLRNKDIQERYAAYVKRMVCYSLCVLGSWSIGVQQLCKHW